MLAKRTSVSNDQSIPRANRPYARKIFTPKIILSKRGCLSQPAQIWPLRVLRSKRRLNELHQVRAGGRINDQKNWRTLGSGDPVFRMGNGAARLRVQFGGEMPVPARRR